MPMASPVASAASNQCLLKTRDEAYYSNGIGDVDKRDILPPYCLCHRFANVIACRQKEMTSFIATCSYRDRCSTYRRRAAVPCLPTPAKVMHGGVYRHGKFAYTPPAKSYAPFGA